MTQPSPPVEPPPWQEPPRVPEPPDRGPLSDFVIVVLAPELPDIDSATELAEVAKELDSSGLGQLLEALGNPPTQRQITSVDPARLRELEGRRGDTVPSLTKFWRVDIRDRETLDPDEVAQRFTDLESVITAYAEVGVSQPATRARAARKQTFTQGYLDPAPKGVDARVVKDYAGGEGQNTGLVDIELSWLLDHPDLIRYLAPVLSNDNQYPGESADHGNGVVGIIGASGATRVGVVGIAPKIRSIGIASHAQGNVKHLVANAIVAAVNVMQRGDILLLEVQRDLWPTETDYSDFVAIQLATQPPTASTPASKGIVVVEAAGNGGPAYNLDAWPPDMPQAAPGRRMQRGNDQSDSRAIMVGACWDGVVGFSATPGGPVVQGHRRWLSSNWGTRVDCHAWGKRVATCRAKRHTDDFTETSAAAAIVAGVAVLAQSIRIGTGGAPLTSEQMRAVLPKGGTPQAPEDNPPGPPVLRPIGTMPNMAIIDAAVRHSGPV